MTLKYDPEAYLESTTRAIKSYVEEAFVGPLDEAYEVVMEFPGMLLEDRKVPMTKSIVHFEMDEDKSQPWGFGEMTGDQNYNEVDHTVNPQEARMHDINFDVGIWASDRSGGTTARMRLKQVLSNLFSGNMALKKFRDATDGGDGGIQIVQFTGGRFVNDTITDVPVYRMVDCQLDVRVFARTPLSLVAGPAIEDIEQASSLTIPS